MATNDPSQPLWGEQTELALANFEVSGTRLPIEVVHALAAIKADAAIINGADQVGDDIARFAAIATAASRDVSGAPGLKPGNPL